MSDQSKPDDEITFEQEIARITRHVEDLQVLVMNAAVRSISEAAGGQRELACARTRLEEAEMWLRRASR